MKAVHRSPPGRAALLREARQALSRAASQLLGAEGPPVLQARAEEGRVSCPGIPFAAAMAATAGRHLLPVVAPSERQRAAGVAERVVALLLEGLDPDGWVRFFGPRAPIIVPDLDDTALVWSELRALAGLEPPPELLDELLGARAPGRAFNTWRRAPAAAPAVEVDPVVNCNVLSLLSALGRDEEVGPKDLVARTLGRVAADERCRVPGYYPEPAALVLMAARARAMGARLPLPATPASWTRGGLLRCAAHVAAAGPGAAPQAVRALLEAQLPSGAWPWAPVFIGGAENHFPGGEVLTRPEFGGEVMSTALASVALAAFAELPPAPVAPLTGRVEARTSGPPAKLEALAGPLDGGVRADLRAEGARWRLVLVSPSGDLPLDATPLAEGVRYYLASKRWAIGYRGRRRPTPTEVRALERLLTRLDEAPEEIVEDLA